MKKCLSEKTPGSAVIVWQGVIIEETESSDALEFIKKLGANKVKYLGKIITKPDVENGQPVPGTGGRNDQFFEIIDAESEFWVNRLKAEFRLLSDIIWSVNGYQDNPIYPDWITEYVDDDDNWDNKK